MAPAKDPDHPTGTASAADGFAHAEDRLVHQGYIWNLVTATFRAPDGSTFERDIVRSPGSVGVLPLMETADGPMVVLVGQYRPPYDHAILEIPAGMRDIAGEPPEDTARRELIEEAGLHAGSLRLLHEMYPSPAMTDATCRIYLATDCVAVDNDRQGPEEQSMVVAELMLADAVALIDDGTIHDAKTVVALLQADRYQRGLLQLD